MTTQEVNTAIKMLTSTDNDKIIAAYSILKLSATSMNYKDCYRLLMTCRVFLTKKLASSCDNKKEVSKIFSEVINNLIRTADMLNPKISHVKRSDDYIDRYVNGLTEDECKKFAILNGK